MPLRLHAITLVDAPHEAGAPATDGNGSHSETMIVPFRELCAVVTERHAFALEEPTPGEVDRHRAIVDAVFHRSAVLPAPVGAVFRNPDVLKRWMELHYVSLTDALEFVEDREVARVHIVRA